MNKQNYTSLTLPYLTPALIISALQVSSRGTTKSQVLLLVAMVITFFGGWCNIPLDDKTDFLLKLNVPEGDLVFVCKIQIIIPDEGETACDLCHVSRLITCSTLSTLYPLRSYL